MQDKALEEMLAHLKKVSDVMPPHVKKLIVEHEELLENRGELLRLGNSVTNLAGAEIKKNPELATKLLLASQIMLDIAQDYADACDEHFKKLNDAF